mmetsp:Transcript_36247/g.81468  ORF Transcript_36247/g.81468 Transcript_36247/m.81468 type:complete len:393 (-) Transcript_36247:904-2082(-)
MAIDNRNKQKVQGGAKAARQRRFGLRTSAFYFISKRSVRPHSGWGFGAWRERRTAPVAPGVDRGRDRGALEQDGLSRAGVDDVRGEDDRMRRVAHDPPMPLKSVELEVPPWRNIPHENLLVPVLHARPEEHRLPLWVLVQKSDRRLPRSRVRRRSHRGAGGRPFGGAGFFFEAVPSDALGWVKGGGPALSRGARVSETDLVPDPEVGCPFGTPNHRAPAVARRPVETPVRVLAVEEDGVGFLRTHDQPSLALRHHLALPAHARGKEREPRVRGPVRGPSLAARPLRRRDRRRVWQGPVVPPPPRVDEWPPLHEFESPLPGEARIAKGCHAVQPVHLAVVDRPPLGEERLPPLLDVAEVEEDGGESVGALQLRGVVVPRPIILEVVMVRDVSL